MYKILVCLFLASICLSCSNTTDSEQVIPLSQKVETDVRFLVLANNFNEIVDILENFNSNNSRSNDDEQIQELSELIIETEEVVTDLSVQYGEDHVEVEIDRLADIDADPPGGIDRRPEEKCCERNENGTNDWSCCNFWETVKVVFKTIPCTIRVDDLPMTSEQINEERDCIQESICSTC